MSNIQTTEDNVMYLDLQLVGDNEQEMFIGDVESIEFRLTTWLSEFIQYWNEQPKSKMEEVLGCSKQAFTTLCHTILDQIEDYCENQVAELDDYSSTALVILNNYNPYTLAVVCSGGQTGFIENNI